MNLLSGSTGTVETGRGRRCSIATYLLYPCCSLSGLSLVCGEEGLGLVALLMMHHMSSQCTDTVMTSSRVAEYVAVYLVGE